MAAKNVYTLRTSAPCVSVLLVLWQSKATKGKGKRRYQFMLSSEKRPTDLSFATEMKTSPATEVLAPPLLVRDVRSPGKHLAIWEGGEQHLVSGRMRCVTAAACCEKTCSSSVVLCAVDNKRH